MLTLVLVTQNLLRRLDELFLIGMTAQDLGVVLRCLLPIALSYAIPMGFVIGLLLAIRRLAGDGELVAWRAAGIGPNQLLGPFLVLGLLAALGSAWLIDGFEPPARRRLVSLFKQVAARGAIVEPGKFRPVGSHIVFVEDRERDGTLLGVMLYDTARAERPYHVFAARGRMRFDGESRAIELALRNGDVHLGPDASAPERYERVHFDALAYRIDVRHLLGTEAGPVRPKQMSRDELHGVLARAAGGDALVELDDRNPHAYSLEIHRRRAQPLAPILLAAVAVPIALTSEHRGRSAAMVGGARHGVRLLRARRRLDRGGRGGRARPGGGTVAPERRARAGGLRADLAQPQLDSDVSDAERRSAGRAFVVHWARGVPSAERDALALHTLGDWERLLEASRQVLVGRGVQHLVATRSESAPIRIRLARRGGVLARVLGDRHLGPARIEREFVTWERLADAGVPTPDLCFAVSWRDGAFWRGAVATRDRGEARDGVALLDGERDDITLVDAARAAGETLARLHEAGFVHGDLHLGNLLFERRTKAPGRRVSSDRVWRCLLVDFDRSRRLRRDALGDRARDAARMLRSLEKQQRTSALPRPALDAALDAYCDGDEALRRALVAYWPRARRAIWRHRVAWWLGRLGRHARGRASALGAIIGLVSTLLGPAGCDAAPPRAPGPPESAARLSLLAVGDTGQPRRGPRRFSGQHIVARGMTAEAGRAPVDALVLLGDNFYPRGVEPSTLETRIKENLAEPYCAFLRLDGRSSGALTGVCPPDPARRGVPIFAVLGNHDLELPSSARLQRETIPEYLPDWRMSNGLAQSFDLGAGVSLVLFESEPAITDPDAIREELVAALAKATGPWRILATHRPIATDDHGNPWLGGYPDFVRSALQASGRPVQLVLSGDHHSLRAFAFDPPLASLQLGVGSGARADPPRASADHPALRFQRMALGFARIDLVGEGAGERLEATLFETAPGSIFDAERPARAVARFVVDLRGHVERVAR